MMPTTLDDPKPDYAEQLAAWAKAKIAAGADPDLVNAKMGEARQAYWKTPAGLHSFRRFLGAQTDAPPDETMGDRAAGVTSALYQGATLGAGNKITAGVRTVLPEAFGGVKGFDFPQALKEQTGILNDYRQRHPVDAAVAELAGSLPTMFATGGAGATARAPETLGVLGRAARMAKQGAAFGGVQGALSANNLEDIPGGAVRGAAFGAAVAPVAGYVGGKAIQGAANVARRVAPSSNVVREIAEAVGANPLTAPEKASDMLGGALRKGGVNPTDAAATITGDAPVSMMELGSQNVKNVARQARNVPSSNAQQTIDTFLGDRATGASGRITDALHTAAGTPITDTQLPIENIIQRRSDAAGPDYAAAYAHGEIKDPATNALIDQALEHPVMNRAWTRGQNLLKLSEPPVSKTVDIPLRSDGRPMVDPSVWERLSPDEQRGFVNSPDLQPSTGGHSPHAPAKPAPEAVAQPRTVAQIDAWKKGLDATIETGYGSENALSKGEAFAYRQMLSRILGGVDQEVPAYATARGNFKGESELKNAAELGAKHFSPSVIPEVAQRQLAEMTPAEQDIYRQNATNAFAARVRGMGANPDLPEAARGVNIVQRLAGDATAGEKLKMLFPDDNAYQGFLKSLAPETDYPVTRKFLTGQSSTAAQLAESAAQPSDYQNLALSALTGTGKMSLIKRAISLMGVGPGGPMQPAVADAIGSHVTQTGSNLADLLQRMGSETAKRAAAKSALATSLSNTLAAQPHSTPDDQ